MSQKGDNEDGILTWMALGLFVAAVIFLLLWFTASNKIVYYFTPIMDFFALPYRLIPDAFAGTVKADLDFTYKLFRSYPNRVGMMDWLDYVNTALKPLSIVLIGTMFWLFKRQHKKVKAQNVNRKITPKDLAQDMMKVFPDIAPVVCIQEKLVANNMPKWARQVFPEELLRKAKYQGKPILVPDPKRGELAVDEDRLRGYFEEVKTWKHENTKLLVSKHLGRQIVDIRLDAKNKEAVFVDRLSDSGKAIFAILAPYAFGGAAGKKESSAVAAALNMSAYGSELGMANLSIPSASESFNKWRKHPLAKRLAKVHHWENTFLHALLEQARRSGKIGTWSFIWLKPTNRVLYYVLNTTGRKTPHSEAAVTFSQFQFEERAAKSGRLPIDANGRPVIFSKRVIEALIEEWEFWLAGGEDNEDWWQDEKLLNWEDNSAFMSALNDASTAPSVPLNIE